MPVLVGRPDPNQNKCGGIGQATVEAIYDMPVAVAQAPGIMRLSVISETWAGGETQVVPALAPVNLLRALDVTVRLGKAIDVLEVKTDDGDSREELLREESGHVSNDLCNVLPGGWKLPGEMLDKHQ